MQKLIIKIGDDNPQTIKEIGDFIRSYNLPYEIDDGEWIIKITKKKSLKK